MHGLPIIKVISRGILADIQGPNTLGGVITVDEYREAIKAYPRIEFLEQTREILCGLCQTKPDTTYDNFVGDFGRAYVDGYGEEWDEKCVNDFFAAALKAC